MTALIWTVAALLLIGLGFVLAAMLFYRESPTPVPEDEVHGDVPRLDHEAKGEA